MVAPDDSVEVNALTLLGTPATGDELHINDISDSDNSFKITIGSALDIINGDVNVDSSGSSSIGSGVIVNADVNASAAIALSKLATDPLARANHTGTQTASTISDYATATATFTNKTIDANGTGNSITNIDVADLANGTDGELITWDAAAAPATVAAGTSGQVLTSNGAGAAPTFQAGGAASTNIEAHVSKSDLTVTSATTGTTLVDIPDLSFTVKANAFYGIYFFTRHESNSVPDIKYGFSIPGTVTGGWNEIQLTSDELDINSTDSRSGNGNIRNGAYMGNFTTDTAGTMTAQFAQQSSSANDTISKAGTHMILVEEE